MVQYGAETNDGTQAAGDFLGQKGKTMNRKIDKNLPEIVIEAPRSLAASRGKT